MKKKPVPDDVVSAEEEARYVKLQRLALDAARSGDTALLDSMLASGLPANLADEKGNTLLMLAAYHGNADTAEAILRRGAEPDRRNDRGQTPLGGVAFKGGLHLCKLLVAHGADPAGDQGGGRLPVHFAALFGHPEIVEFLESQKRGGKPSRFLRACASFTRLLRGFIGR